MRGIYGFDEETLIGGFYAVDSDGSTETSLLGAEASFQTGNFNYQGYFASAATEGFSSDTSESATGMSAEYLLGRSLYLSGALDVYSIFTNTASIEYLNVEIGGRLKVNEFGSAYGRLGSYSVMTSASLASVGSESYLEFGGQVDFGPAADTVMQNRSSYTALGF